MKKTFRFLSMAALALMGAMMTGCSSEDDSIIDNPQQPANTSNVVTLTTTIGFDANTSTRALASGGVKTFAEGDQIAVIYKNASDETIKTVSTISSGAGTKTATFTVALTNPDNTKAIRYIYPAAMAKATIATNATIDDDGTVDFTKLNSQTGSLTTLGNNLDLCTLDAANWTSGTLPTGTLENKLAILAITVKNSGGTDKTSTITSLSVGDGSNVYSVTRDAIAGPIYVAIRPVASANIDITANEGSQCYNKSLTGKTYAASNGYSVSWKMPEALISNANTVNYGMAVCAAGHLHPAKTAVPSGCTAVGILGKVTATGHGLILALKNATAQTWNTINGWTSETTYAGTTLKLLPDDAARGSLTSYTTLGSTAVSNWAVAQKSDYEAIFTNLGSTVSDKDGYTYDGNVNAYITTGVGGTAISGANWSATVLSGSNNAWYFGSNSSKWNNDQKTSSHSVRPVLGF